MASPVVEGKWHSCRLVVVFYLLWENSARNLGLFCSELSAFEPQGEEGGESEDEAESEYAPTESEEEESSSQEEYSSETETSEDGSGEDTAHEGAWTQTRMNLVRLALCVLSVLASACLKNAKKGEKMSPV